MAVVLAALAALVAGPAPLGARPATDPLAACQAEIDAGAPRTNLYACWYDAARTHNLWDEVRRLLDDALAREPDEPAIAIALGNLESDRSRPRAEEMYLRAAAGFAARGQWRGAVYARLNLANHLRRSDRMDDSDHQLDLAAADAERSGAPLLVTTVQLEQARQLQIKGHELSRARRILLDVESRLFPDGPYQQKLATLHGLAKISADLSRYDDAVAYFERILAMVRSHGDPFVEATILRNLFEVRVLATQDEDDGRPRPDLVAEGHAALLANQTAGNVMMAGAVEAMLGQIEEPGEGRIHFEHCLATGREARVMKLEAQCASGLAVVLARSEPERSRELLARARTLTEGTVDRRTIESLWLHHTAAALARDDRAAAIDAVNRWIDASERLRDTQSDAEARAEVFGRRSLAYSVAVGLVLGPRERPAPPAAVGEAFGVLERMRARSLLDALDAAGATVELVPDSPARQRHDRTLGDIAAIQRRLMEPDLAAPDRSAALVELARLEREEAAQREELAADHPGYAVARAPHFADLASVQAELGEGDVVLAYQLAPWTTFRLGFGGGSWLIAITRDDARAYPIDPVGLDDRIDAWAGLIARRDDSGGAAAARLYRELVAPADELIGPSGALIILPDGPLHRLPFAALRARADGPPLAGRHTIAMVPSATLWLRLRHARPVPGRGLAMADPTPVADGAPDARVAALVRAWSLDGTLELGALPHARDEARAMAAALPDHPEVRVGAAASEAALRRTALTDFGLIHFAAHAVVDDRNEARSAIVLAPGDEQHDGLLQEREVVSLDMAGRTVVLSACRSASGRTLRGEGVIGLSRAFLVAGARAVVASQWPLRDDDAAALFGAFYRRLADGATVGDALAGAQRDRIDAGAPTEAWAGLVVLGDPTVRLAAAAPPHRAAAAWAPAVPFGGGVVVALIALGARRRRRRRRRAAR